MCKHTHAYLSLSIYIYIYMYIYIYIYIVSYGRIVGNTYCLCNTLSVRSGAREGATCA